MGRSALIADWKIRCATKTSALFRGVSFSVIAHKTNVPQVADLGKQWCRRGDFNPKYTRPLERRTGRPMRRDASPMSCDDTTGISPRATVAV